jgi:hypothetical protein
MPKFRIVWILRLLIAGFLWLLVHAVYLRVFDRESIGLLPNSVLIDLAGNAIDTGKKQTGCGKQQYEVVPEILPQYQYRFQPKSEFADKCPYVTIFMDPYWGDVAGRVEDKK